MAKYHNPFKPNYPIYDGLFVGRIDEIRKIDEALTQLDNDSPMNLLFLGERGIGKTSLLLLAKHLSIGNVNIGNAHNYITVNININKNMTLIDFIIRFRKVLEREIHKIDSTKKILDTIWKFTEKLELGGFKVNKEQESSIEEIITNFTFSLIETIDKIKSNTTINKKGIVLIIDEVDTSNKDLGLGGFLKNLTETLTIEECHNFMIIMSGLPNTRDILRESHESSLRLFEEETLGPLIRQDSLKVLQMGLDKIKEVDNIEISIEEEAKTLFCGYCEGYPHFIQQIAFSTISDLQSNIITGDIVSNSMSRKGGALDLIGKRYYVDLFYEKINVDSYRQILEIMAENWNDWTTKSDIRAKFSGSGTDLTNGLKALRDRNIILTKKGVKGTYRLQWLSFAFWIKIHKSFEINN